MFQECRLKGNVLIVGGAGFIGSHCAKMLVKAGWTVTVYDNLSKGYREALLYGDFVEGDIGDKQALLKLFEEREIDAVMHFAAFIEVGESVKKPELYFNNNTEKTFILLDAMRQRGVNKFIFSSTAAVYGNPQFTPITEEHPCAPISPYGESKLRVEEKLATLTNNGMNSVIFRYFNAAGADPAGELGERHNPESHLIPLAIKAALKKRDPLSVFGTDYETKDGTAVRDYIHVNDLCKAHILGLEYLMNGGKSNLFNLGNGEGFSVREVLKSVEKNLGVPVPATDCPRRDGDAPTLVGDASKAKSVLGWKPDIPNLDDIVKTACNFEKKL
ncbi:MAG: UDP-glucose 4-epimerase GalE [Fibrobacteres bacterium]|nr:UDP-glucose 4-epimerase GalE [Fibrobacterota bacterium]